MPPGRLTGVIENDQRQDVTPLEQARSYQALMDSTGWTVEELGARIGKAPHRITERTALLNLRPEYQALLASGNLKPSEATELVRLSPRGQDTLFNAIRTGGCRNDYDLRASATALVNAEAQLLLMPDAPPPPTKEDRDLANAFEAHVERVAALLRSGIHENQIVAVSRPAVALGRLWREMIPGQRLPVRSGIYLRGGSAEDSAEERGAAGSDGRGRIAAGAGDFSALHGVAAWAFRVRRTTPAPQASGGCGLIVPRRALSRLLPALRRTRRGGLAACQQRWLVSVGGIAKNKHLTQMQADAGRCTQMVRGGMNCRGRHRLRLHRGNTLGVGLLATIGQGLAARPAGTSRPSAGLRGFSA